MPLLPFPRAGVKREHHHTWQNIMICFWFVYTCMHDGGCFERYSLQKPLGIGLFVGWVCGWFWGQALLHSLWTGGPQVLPQPLMCWHCRCAPPWPTLSLCLPWPFPMWFITQCTYRSLSPYIIPVIQSKGMIEHKRKAAFGKADGIMASLRPKTKEQLQLKTTF